MTADSDVAAAIIELSRWVRVACHQPVKLMLEATLPDTKSRQIYQMTEETVGRNQICKACKVSSSTVSDVQQKCISLGLMSVSGDGRRKRLFDLNDFDLLSSTADK
ncbi:MAG: hypothetical protein H7144_15075 [Burkholderiales bacterium]|nr:hypothetical protein [Phycisphaerae bacterium]